MYQKNASESQQPELHKKVHWIIDTLEDAKKNLNNSNLLIQNFAKQLVFMQETIMCNWRSAELTARVHESPTQEELNNIEKWKLLAKVYNCSYFVKKHINLLSEEEQKTIVDEIEPLCNNFTFAKRGDLKKMFYFSVTIPQKNKEYVTKHDSSYDHSLLNNNRGAIRAIE